MIYFIFQGCLHEKLVLRQMSPTSSLPESYSPCLDSLLHISEESLSRDTKYDDHLSTRKTANELNENDGKVGSISSNSSVGVSSAPESEVSFLSTSNDENSSEKKAECEAKLINPSDSSVGSKGVTIISSEANPTKNVSSEDTTNNLNVTRRGSQSDVYIIPTSANDESSLTQCPASTYIQSQINSSPGLASNQPLFSSPHNSNLMSASYPSPGFSVLTSQPHIPHGPMVHPSTSEIYNARYANPISCYQQVVLYQNPAYQSNPVGTNVVLQSTPDLTGYSMYQPTPGVSMLCYE